MAQKNYQRVHLRLNLNCISLSMEQYQLTNRTKNDQISERFILRRSEIYPNFNINGQNSDSAATPNMHRVIVPYIYP